MMVYVAMQLSLSTLKWIRSATEHDFQNTEFYFVILRSNMTYACMSQKEPTMHLLTIVDSLQYHFILFV